MGCEFAPPGHSAGRLDRETVEDWGEAPRHGRLRRAGPAAKMEIQGKDGFVVRADLLSDGWLLEL